jgi:hypothetical protein
LGGGTSSAEKYYSGFARKLVFGARKYLTGVTKDRDFSDGFTPKWKADVPELVIPRGSGDGKVVVDKLAMSTRERPMAYNIMILRMYMLLLKAYYDAAENALYLMFETQKPGAFGRLEENINNVIEFESSVLNDLSSEINAFSNAYNESGEKEKKIIDAKADLIDKGIEAAASGLVAVPPYPVGPGLMAGFKMSFEQVTLGRKYKFGPFAPQFSAHRYLDDSVSADATPANVSLNYLPGVYAPGYEPDLVSGKSKFTDSPYHNQIQTQADIHEDALRW